MPEHGDGVPAAHKRRDGSPIPLRQLDGEPGGVDLAALVEGVGELQLRIPEGAGERVAKPARGGRLAKLNHEARHLVAGPPATHPRQHHAERECDQRGGLARPQPLLDLVVGEESAAEAVGVVGRDEPEIHHRREQHGRRQEPRRGRRPRDAPRGDAGKRGRPGEAEPNAVALKGRQETGVAGGREVVGGALRAPLRRRVEHERRGETEQQDRRPVGDTQHESLERRRQAPARIGERGMRHERRAGGVAHQADCECHPGADPGVVERGKKPGEARGHQQDAEPAGGPARPRDRPGDDQRPPGARERKARRDRIPGQRTGGILARDTERRHTERDARQDHRELLPSHKRTLPHHALRAGLYLRGPTWWGSCEGTRARRPSMARTEAQRAAVAVLAAALALAVGGCLGSNSDKAGGAQHQKPVVLTMANGNGLPLELEPFAAAVARLSNNTVRIEFKNNWRQGSPSYETGGDRRRQGRQGRPGLGGLPRVRQRRRAHLRRAARAAADRQLRAGAESAPEPARGRHARRAQAARRSGHRHPPGPDAQATRCIAPGPTRGLPRQDDRHLAVTRCAGRRCGRSARAPRKSRPAAGSTRSTASSSRSVRSRATATTGRQVPDRERQPLAAAPGPVHEQEGVRRAQRHPARRTPCGSAKRAAGHDGVRAQARRGRGRRTCAAESSRSSRPATADLASRSGVRSGRSTTASSATRSTKSAIEQIRTMRSGAPSTPEAPRCSKREHRRRVPRARPRQSTGCIA